ncbi:hypothetical protein H0H92_002000 [Tricholoma furcatifolium]|nr:hypothetical protein H0H92_002000 [Tricholoma furcatifolium]
MKLSASFTALLSLIPFVTAGAIPSAATPTNSAGLPISTSKAYLNQVAREAKKLYFGTATDLFFFDGSDSGENTDQPYISILEDVKTFGQLTAGNTMKWEYTEPERGVFNFTESDELVKFAEHNGQIMRGHNCVWYNELPDWLTSVTWDAPTLAEIVTTHCYNVVKHFEGKIYSWDVINEPFNDDGTFREDMWYNTLNTSYIPITLLAARAADPFAKLYINDYNIEGPGAKSTAMINLVKQLQSEGIPIDGVGVQGHLIVGELPSGIEDNLRAFTEAGVEVAITELDIRMNLPATPALLEQQKADYQTVITACKNVPGCVGVTVWDFSDEYSWVPSTFPGQGDACPWDDNMQRKPAYDGIAAGFQ